VTDAELTRALGLAFGASLANLLAMLLHTGLFAAKLSAVLLLQGLAHWVLPSFAPERALRVGWKVLVPLSLINLAATASGLALLEQWRR
jgi:NADH-quinone oxidoreductase subunit H